MYMADEPFRMMAFTSSPRDSMLYSQGFSAITFLCST